MVNLKEIKAFFANYKHSGEPIILSQCETITDLDKFLESTFAILEANSGNKTMMPYYDRLAKVYKILIQNTNN